MKKEVNSNIYDTNYFLSNNEGYREYENGLGNNIHPKFARALEIANPKHGEVGLDMPCGTYIDKSPALAFCKAVEKLIDD